MGAVPGRSPASPALEPATPMDVAQPLELRPLPSEGLLGQTASGAGSTDTREVACLSGPIVLTEEREAAASSSKRNIDEVATEVVHDCAEESASAVLHPRQGLRWTDEEETRLRTLVLEYGNGKIDWSAIDRKLERVACKKHWRGSKHWELTAASTVAKDVECLPPDSKRRRSAVKQSDDMIRIDPRPHNWTPAQDEELIRFVNSDLPRKDWEPAFARRMGRPPAACSRRIYKLRKKQDLLSAKQPAPSTSAATLNASTSLLHSDTPTSEPGGSGSIRMDSDARSDKRRVPVDTPLASKSYVEFDPVVRAHNASLDRIRQEVASKIAIVVALEERNRRLQAEQAARNTLAEVGLRLAAACVQEQQLKEEVEVHLRIQPRDDRRFGSGSANNTTGVHPPLPICFQIPLVAQPVPAATASTHVQQRSFPPGGTSTSTLSSAPHRPVLITLESSDESSDQSEDEDDDEDDD